MPFQLDIIGLIYAYLKTKKKTDNKQNKYQYTVPSQKANSNIGLLPAD